MRESTIELWRLKRVALSAIPVLCLALGTCPCGAGQPPIQHVPWDQNLRDLAATIDRHVLECDEKKFRALTDNRDRVHLTVRFNYLGWRLVQVAAPESWGEQRAVDCASECARQLGWPVAARFASTADGSIIAGIAGRSRAERCWTETLPWPDLVGALRRAGASRAELRIRAAGLPIASSEGFQRWEDAGNAATEIRVRVCQTSLPPPPPMRLTVGFPPGFVERRVQWGALTLLFSVGTLFGLHAWASRRVSRGKRLGFALTVLRNVPWLLTILWCVEAIQSGTTFLPTLLRTSPAARTTARLAILFGPPLLFFLISYALHRRLRKYDAVEPKPRPTTALNGLGAVTMIIAAAVGILLALRHPATTSTPIRHLQRAAEWLILASGILSLISGLLLRAAHGLRSAVRSGDLVERCHVLAARADVRLALVQVIDGKFVRANGFAGVGGVVSVSRLALLHLTRQEIDALLAHELAHMKLGHLNKRLRGIYLCVLPCGAVGAWAVLTGHLLAAGAAVLFAPFSILIWSPVWRKQEKAADIAGVELIEDPRAMIRMLATLSRVNGRRLDCSRLTTALSTHPSFLSRINAIAMHFGIAPDEVDRIIAQTREIVEIRHQERYELHDDDTRALRPAVTRSSG